MSDIASKYRMLDDREHVRLRPGRYVGSINDHHGMCWVFDDTKKKFRRREAVSNPAFIKLFDEIISNSVDFSKTKEGKHLDTIQVTIDEASETITVEDNGGIPVVIHPEYNVYIPELIFSNLKAGSNFDDTEDSTGTGQNGEGAALVAIFSHEFDVYTGDGRHSFSQVYTDNLARKSNVVVEQDSYKGTTIAYRPDCSILKTSFKDNVHALVRRVYDIAGTNPKLKVSLNGSRVGPFKSFSDYVSKCYDSDAVSYSTKDWNVAVGVSSDGFEHVSFVNSTETKVGGSHINHVSQAITSKLRELILKKHKVDVKPSQISQQMRLFVDATIVRPRYSSQTKDDLITEEREFQSKFEPTDAFIKEIFDSPVVEAVMDWVMAKQRAEELAALRKKQKEAKKSRVAEHIEATGKGDKPRVLHLMEGLSAVNNFINVRDAEVHGAYPLRGKLLNIREESLGKIAKTQELMNIMAIIGLQIGKPASSLNYEIIRITTDMDYDGISIAALLINFFSMWPELFDEGRIQVLQSPIYVASKGKDAKRYYSYDEFNQDNAAGLLKGYQIEHMKGLGSLSVDDYREMICNPRFIKIARDTGAEKHLDIAFGGSSKKRKDWLMEGQD